MIPVLKLAVFCTYQCWHYISFQDLDEDEDEGDEAYDDIEQTEQDVSSLYRDHSHVHTKSRNKPNRT